MRDEQELIKARLGKLGLAPHREEEILRELGEHLADHAAALESKGAAKDAAIRQALDSVSNWDEFRKGILSAETANGGMNYLTKVFWLPALGTFALNMGLLAYLQIARLRPAFFLWSGLIPIYLPWLIALPMIGALGALWSKRAGGSILLQLLASQASALIWECIMLVMLPFSLVLDRGVPVSLKMEGLLIYVVAWVLLPSFALFLGGSPFLRKPQAQS
jgi:hypothetical protein